MSRRLPPLLPLLVAAALVAPAISRAQQPASQTFLIAHGSPDALSQRYAKLIAVEVSRRSVLVAETEATALLSRPLSAAVSDCAGDDLCFVALGQVVRATTVVVATARDSAAEAGRYDCTFRVIDVRSGKAATPIVFRVSSTEAGLAQAAAVAGDRIVPRPRAVSVTTPTPIVSTPTPVVVAPTPAPTPAIAAVSGAEEPTPTPGTPGLDVVPERPRARKPRPPLTRDPAFWGIAGGGVLVLGLGMFFGASSFTEKEEKPEGTSTVGVRF